MPAIRHVGRISACSLGRRALSAAPLMGRNLPVQPILFPGQGEPTLRHAREAFDTGLVGLLVRQLEAVFCVFPESIGLSLHA